MLCVHNTFTNSNLYVKSPLLWWLILNFKLNFMIKKDKLIFGLVLPLLMSLFLASCHPDPDRETFPLSADISNSVDGKQVAFQGLSHSATSWMWDFGDGTTSTEQNPVHVYTDGGYYTVDFTATDDEGNVETDQVTLALAVTNYTLLTGGPTAANGKTWKLAASHTAAGDFLAYANIDLTPVLPEYTPLPNGTFGLLLGYGEIYDDTFTFHFDGGYEIMPKAADGGVFSGLVHQFVTTGGADIVELHPDAEDFGMCRAKYTPEEGASFSYVAQEDFDVPIIPAFGGVAAWKDVTTLDFSGSGFLGFRDFQSKVIVLSITDTSMQVIMYMAASPGDLPANSHALVLSFEVVN